MVETQFQTAEWAKYSQFDLRHRFWQNFIQCDRYSTNFGKILANTKFLIDTKGNIFEFGQGLTPPFGPGK
jgi:hypothetical protein